MRKSIIAALAALVVVVGAAGGWVVLRHLLHDPVASARVLLAKGDIRGGLLELRNAVRNNPADPVAHALLGQVQLLVGDAVAAEKELKQARDLHYQGPELVATLARSYLGQERFRDLLRDFPPDSGLPPEQEASLLVSRALAQVALRDPVAALASAAAAERLAPGLAEAPLATARILAANGDPVRALLKVGQALKLDPRLLEALGLKSDIEREQGEVDQAVATLDQAVAVAPALPRVHLARARALLLQGEDAKAQADITLALKGEPKSTLALYLQTLLYVRAKNWTAADVTLQKLQPVLAQVPRGDYYTALVKANLNQLEQAAEAITRYTSRNPSDLDGLRLLARVDLLMGKKAAAAAALQQVTERGGSETRRPVGAEVQVQSGGVAADSAESLTHLASAQLDTGDTGAAARDLEQSLETIPKRTDTGSTQVLSALAAGDVARAQTALEQLQREPKAEPEVVGNLTGLVRMAQLDFEGARAAWQEALQATPQSATLRINLARALVLLDRGPEAEKLLGDQLLEQPANLPALRTLIEMLLAQNRLHDALAVVQTARRSAPAVISLLVTEAALRAQDHDFAGAYSVLDEVPLEQAQSPLLLTVRAQLMLAQDRKKDAADNFRQILLGHPGDLTTRQRLMQLLVAMDQPDEALQLARQGLVQTPGNSQLLQTVVALVYKTQGLAAALAEAEQMRRDPINLPAARLLKGSLYMTAKRYADAAAAFAEEMKDAPFNALAIATAGALDAAGKPDEALALLRDWVAKQPDPIVSDSLAGLDIEAHKLDEAEQNLLAVLAERPNDPVALNNLAWLYQRQGNPKALALARKSYLLSPSPQTADTLGWIETGQGNAKLGLLLLQRAAGPLRNDPAVLFHLATALKQNGKPDEAARLLEAVLSKGGAFEERAEAVKLQAELPPPRPPISGPPAPAAPAPKK
jgi:predicted Zn-dependent protease